MSTRALLERLERRSVRHLAEGDVHAGQVALMRFLSEAARKLGVAQHVYVVGGAVRDFVIGSPIKDVDVVVDALALKGKGSEWFAKELQRVIPAKTAVATNQYGVAIVTVSGAWDLLGHALGGSVIEIANARKESYGGAAGKGYKPTAVDLATIRDDAFRREFTFNTLMWRMSDLAQGPDKAAILDLTGCGLRDLRAGEMRCPSDPDKTFSDDPTRMLRAIKFLVRYDWKIPPDVRAAIRRNAQKLAQVPHEAVVGLLVHDVLKEATYKKAIAEMEALGLLEVIATMIKTTPAMAAAMDRWSGNQRVKVLIDMMDVGLSPGRKVAFLTKPQMEKFRAMILTMDEEEADQLADMLKSPGKALKMDLLIQQLGLKGAQIKELVHVARDVLLTRPKVVGSAATYHTNIDFFTNVVRQAAKERGIGEAALFDVALRVLAEDGAAVEVHFFDFDNTLFRSPVKPDWWDAKRKWWSDPASLDPPCVPAHPGAEWWIQPVVAAAKQSTRNPNVYAVLLTGRHDRVYRWRVPELLRQAGLNFDEVNLAPGEASTLSWKLGMMKRILSRFPEARTVHIWEDRDHIADFEKQAQRLGFAVESHRVSEPDQQVACSQKEWADVWK